MLLEFDNNPNIPIEQRLQSFKESVQRALEDLELRTGKGLLIDKDGHVMLDPMGHTHEYLPLTGGYIMGDLHINDKNYYDGKPGFYFDPRGFLQIQRNGDGHPYIALSLQNSKASDGMIRVNKDTGQMEFRDAEDYVFDGDVVVPNTLGYWGKDASGNARQLLAMSANNNCIVGYDCYEHGLGNIHIYGNDVRLYSAAAGKVAMRPYYRAGDSFTTNIYTGGFITGSSKSVGFSLPLHKPVLGSPTVTVTSNAGIVVRQAGKYCYGSSSSTYIKPSSISASIQGNHLNINAAMANATDVTTNNDACGIMASIVVTFS